MTAGSAMNAMDRAVKYLSAGPKTKWQVTEYLRKKEYAEDEIREATDELEKYRYIDDLAYCKLYFQYGFEKGRGADRIRAELKDRGVSSETIEIACDELEEIPDEFETALAIGETMLPAQDVKELSYDDKRKLQGRIGRKLSGRGFSLGTVNKVIDRLLF